MNRSTRVRLGMVAGAGVLAIAGGACAPLKPGSQPQLFTRTFNCSDGAESFSVPPGVTQIAVDAYGAQGGAGEVTGVGTDVGPGGFGGRASAVVAVAPGESLEVNVGCEGSPGNADAGSLGGFNGGGSGGVTNIGPDGGGGGGRSDVKRSGSALVVAGGGGGGGSSTGGNGGDGGKGGGTTGTVGESGSAGAEGGEPGTDIGEGAGGHGCSTPCDGSPGVGVDGGGGGADGVAGGGGGGGRFGGGGGGGGDNGVTENAGAGGGGGSGLGPSGTTFEVGIRAGDGLIVISWLA